MELDVKFVGRVGRLPEYIFGKLNAIKLARRRAGHGIIDLGMGNPNDPTPQPIIAKLVEAVQDPRNHRYSVSADGIFNLKRELARFYKREYGVALDPEREVICTIGSKEGISHLALALMEGGDTAIAPGAAFGEGGDGGVRMAIVENKQRLRQAVRQIGRALRLNRVRT